MTARLAIVSSHPIQYNAPAFRSLASNPDLEVRVFYEWEGPGSTIDPEFGRAVEWDVPLLDGYDHTFVPNSARDPGSHRFLGIDNPTLIEEIRHWQPDVLLVYGWAFASHLRVLRAFHGKVPILFRGDSTLLDDRSAGRSAARRAVLRWVYAHIDIALYAGKLNREYFMHNGMREDQLVWAPHAVDNDRFFESGESSEAEARKWRARLGIVDDDMVFLLPAKLIPLKDPFTLLNAFIELSSSAQNHRAHLVFAGDGELLDPLRAQCAERSDVHFLGFQNQSFMPTVYRVADIVVLPSLTETWGLAINEAFACGRAAIVSDRVGCAADLVIPGRTGFVFPHRSVVGLRDAMSVFAANRDLTVASGLQAQALIQNWSIRAFAVAVAGAVANAVGAVAPLSP